MRNKISMIGNVMGAKHSERKTGPGDADMFFFLLQEVTGNNPELNSPAF